VQNGGCFKRDYLNVRRLKPAATILKRKGFAVCGEMEVYIDFCNIEESK